MDTTQDGMPWYATKQPRWGVHDRYEIREIKPKKRLIDWAAVPRGVMTNHGELLFTHEEYVKLLRDNKVFWVIDTRLPNELRLAHAAEQPWITVDRSFLKGQQVLGYDSLEIGGTDFASIRVDGLAQGYTDNPSEAE